MLAMQPVEQPPMPRVDSSKTRRIVESDGHGANVVGFPYGSLTTRRAT